MGIRLYSLIHIVCSCTLVPNISLQVVYVHVCMCMGVCACVYVHVCIQDYYGKRSHSQLNFHSHTIHFGVFVVKGQGSCMIAFITHCVCMQ